MCKDIANLLEESIKEAVKSVLRIIIEHNKVCQVSCLSWRVIWKTRTRTRRHGHADMENADMENAGMENADKHIKILA